MVDAVLSRTVSPPSSDAVTSIARHTRNLPVWVWLISIVLLPNLLLVGVSFLKVSNGLLVLQAGVTTYLRLWHSASFAELLGRTLGTSFFAACIGLLIAYPMGYYAARVVQRNQALAVVLVVIPLWISLLMRVFAWRMILGQNGILNSFLVSSGFISTPSSAFLYTPFAVLLTYVYIAIPYIFVASFTALEKIPQSLIEASQDSGASSLQTFRHVILPLSLPSVAIGVSLAFLTTVGDYVTPSMVGGLDGTMLGTVIASQFGVANNWPYGAAVAVVLMLGAALVLGLIIAVSRSRGILTGDEGARPRPMGIALTGSQRLLRVAGFLCFCLPYIFLYAPLLVMVLFSLNDSKVQAFPLQGFSLRWYRELWTTPGLLEAVQRSLVVAAFVVTLSTIVGTGFALLIHHSRSRILHGCEFLLAFPIAVPGVVLGITMVLGMQLLSVPQGIPRIVIGQSSFVMPVILLIVLARLRRLDPAILEASLDSGAGPLRSFIYVLLPMIRNVIIGGALLGLTLSVDDVMVTLFLSGTEPTLPIWVWNQMRFGFTPSVNAIFTLVGAVSLILVGFFSRLVEQR